MGMGTDWPLLFSRTTVRGSISGGRVEREVGVRTAVDVKAVLQAVDGGDLALTALVGAADNLDLVLRNVSKPLVWGVCDTYILADGNAAHTVLFAELLTQWRLKIVRTCPS